VVRSFDPEKNHRIFKTVTSGDKKQGAGKSGKQILMTHDKKFIVKEIDKDEKEQIVNISKKYMQHLEGNPDCIFAKIFGVFCLRIENVSKYYFIIMQNLEPFPSKSVVFRYDLKFSEVNRKHVDAEADLQVIHDFLI
jgi:hypothetical protein